MEKISTKQARDNLSDLINRVVYTKEKYTFTRHGHGVAVILSLDEWNAIETRLQKMEDEEDILDADEAYANYMKEGGVPFSKIKNQ